MSKNSYAVLGLGSFGSTLAVELSKAGHTVLACDLYLAGEALVEEPRDPRDSLLPVPGHPGDYREGPGDIPDLPGVLRDFHYVRGGFALFTLL